MNRLAFLALPAALLLPSVALADDDAAKVGDVDIRNADKDKKPDGVFPFLYLDAQFSLSDNRGWFGQPDGTTATFGYRLETGFNLRIKKSEIDLDFLSAQTLTKTPVVDELIKGRDIVDLAAIYQYRAIKWVGPYVRVQATTQAFRGTDFRATDTRYHVTRIDGQTVDVIRKRLLVTDPFQPFIIKESAGVFVEPVELKEFDLDLRLGVAGRHMFADGQLAVTDDAATADVVEVTELRTTHQVGAELVVVAEGKLKDDYFGYKVKGEMMVPFVTSPGPLDATGQEKSPLDLINFDLQAQLKFKIAKYASLDYELRVLRQPALVDTVQVQNNLLLSLGVQAGRPKPK